MSKAKYLFETEDAQLAFRIFQLINPAGAGVVAHEGGAMAVAAPAAHALPEALQPQPHVAPVAPPATHAALPPAAPVAPPVVEHAPPPAPAKKPKGEAPAGWTKEHIVNAAKTHGEVHGPAALKAIAESYGEKKVTDVDPALWPQLYGQLVVGTSLQTAG